MSKFTPSTYQAAIFDWIANGSGNATVEAVPGSGKTTTSVAGATFIPAGKTAKFLAFNKHSANDLKAKLPRHIASGTIHSTALGSFFRPGIRPEERKYGDIIRAFVNDTPALSFLRKEERAEFVKQTRGLVNMARLTLTDVSTDEALWSLADHFGIAVTQPEIMFGITRRALQRGIEIRETVIDFTDLLWLPEVLDLKSRNHYDFLIVDEGQDLNAAQLAIVLRILAVGGRVLVVGDGFQAIYGFAGAQSDSMEQIRTKLNATRLDLSICYRCPAGHVRMVANLNPKIEARPDAPEGSVFEIQDQNLYRHVAPGSLVLCRCTAPLVQACLTLIKNRISAKVRGRDIGEQLVSVLRAISEMDGFRFVEYKAYAERFLRARVEQLEAMRGDVESKVQAVTDQIETLEVIIDMTVPASVAEFEQSIQQLFSDDEPDVWLSTIHRAKGLEAEKVFILRPSLMPHSAAKQDWEQAQEMNLLYVAASRSTGDMYIVKSREDIGGSVLEGWARLAGVQIEVLDQEPPVVTSEPEQAAPQSDAPAVTSEPVEAPVVNLTEVISSELRDALTAVMVKYQSKANKNEIMNALLNVDGSINKAIEALLEQGR